MCVCYIILLIKKHFKFKKKITFDFTFDMFLIFLWVDNEIIFETIIEVSHLNLCIIIKYVLYMAD